jgi:hypothetical protein
MKGEYLIKFSMFFIVIVSYLDMSAQPYQEIEYPVEIDGRNLYNPFCGGIGVPQFSEIDFDKDGVKDIFIFDRYGGRIIPYIAVDQGGYYSYKYAPEYRQGFPRLAEWVLLRDYNNDGLMDIFTCSLNQGPFGVEVFTAKSDGSYERYEWPDEDFDILYFETGGADRSQIYVSAIDFPSIDDIDGDGDMDILTFENLGSTVHYYRNVAVEEGLGTSTLKYVLEDDCWGKFYEAEFNEEISLSPTDDECASGLVGEDENKLRQHSGSTLTSYDLDSDGDKDIFIGDLTNDNIVYVENGGDAQKAWMVDQDVTFPSYDQKVEMPIFLATFFLDYNKDGVDDMIATINDPFSSENIFNQWYYVGYKDQNDHLFSLEQRDVFTEKMIDLGTGSRPVIVDFNGDGLKDILIGNDYKYNGPAKDQASIFLFQNNGTSDMPEFRLVDQDVLTMSRFSGGAGSNYTTAFSPAVGDLDGDQDLDILIGCENGSLYYAENIGTPGGPLEFGSVVTNYMDIDIGSSSVPAIVDINEDGLGDLIVGTRQGTVDENFEACGSMYYFENIGQIGNAQFDHDEFSGNNDPCFGNLLFKRYGSKVYSSPYVYEFENEKRLYLGTNQGIKVITDISDSPDATFDLIDDELGEIWSDERLHVAIDDLDNDDVLELIVGHVSGGLTVYKTDHRVDGSVAVKDNMVSEMLIYPNPTNSEIHFSTMSRVSYEVIDMKGSVILKGYSDGVIRLRDQMPIGMYIIKFVDESNDVSIARFIKE